MYAAGPWGMAAFIPESRAQGERSVLFMEPLIQFMEPLILFPKKRSNLKI